MNAYNYLIDKAITDIWCNREQDSRYIFKPSKISKPLGELNEMLYGGSHLNLPDKINRYNVYQIGQLTPKIIGLLNDTFNWTTRNWVSFKDVINTNRLFVNLYTSKGVEISKFNSYYVFTRSRGLLIAIENNSNFGVDFEEEEIYIRLYSNAFFESDRSNNVTDFIYTNGKKKLNTTNEILILQNECTVYKNKRGYTYCYVNGYFVNNISLLTVNIGDTAEFIYDSSIKRTVSMKIGNIPTFGSILDNKYKYLLHYPKTSNDIIDFYDDIDIHIVSIGLNNSFIGRYYNVNLDDSIRMVTHKDYSIPVDYVNYVANEFNIDKYSQNMSIDDFYVSIKIRDSGYSRPLVNESSRLFELYKLPDNKVIQSMVGVNSTVSEWKAENLENSSYVKLMNSFYNNININLVEKAYGYNSMSKILADTPTNTYIDSSNQIASLPYLLQNNSTIYEYSSDGVLLGRYIHNSGTSYICVNNDTRMIEGLVGKGLSKPSVKFGETNIPLPTNYSYRVYKSHITNGEVDNDWEDVTNSNLYTVNNNILVKSNTTINTMFMVRDDSSFLAYKVNILPIAGTLYFTLSETEDRGIGNENYILPVPLGDLTIFLNGKSLIRDLDYFVVFPKVYIVNKNYLVQPDNTSLQTIEVRFNGFCTSDLSIDKVNDYGFIEHGFLSNNNKYDIRDDKVLRIVVDGNLKQKSDILFSEEHTGISVVNGLNGLPYLIDDIIVPMRSLLDQDTYTLRDLSLDLDNRISNYMSINKPQPPRNQVSSISQKYVLVSPFICHITLDLFNNEIDNVSINKKLTDNEILDLVKHYEFLLEFDPINETKNMDYRYIDIHPHSVNSVLDLNAFQYKFLSRVVDLYCNNLITLSPFITITV